MSYSSDTPFPKEIKGILINRPRPIPINQPGDETL